ncbi:dUTP diphosphatase [Candidatus Woesearchaeota archaeon]|jgi:dUTP pyrophosphatase|nr:dUTP diphosphatase [Candidatus Woesearchaeota archaeon]MBT4387294.1 dUTP diphosphatase [Candidatus Woesearchaeota archaeon]MBT4595433.1 dUTP diphosphatase [Candidatus Woesearchaeota archaeon]MBT5741148.1 dUTP diphosphatase [Candidatus Woesearchaeota archaeon]MBT6505302.1 dUTP diphosphatase [Candidatus Woesearchaeota archaeon]
MRIKTLDPNMPDLKYHSEHAAAIDLLAGEKTIIEPGQHTLIDTKVCFEIPNGHVGLIWDKSGVANKRKLTLMGGVIDADYRGEIKVGLINIGLETQTFEKYEKIAQILIQKVERVEIEMVEELNETGRSDGGFGSTGRF